MYPEAPVTRQCRDSGSGCPSVLTRVSPTGRSDAVSRARFEHRRGLSTYPLNGTTARRTRYVTRSG
ncbi:hypothetical protein GCM10023336_73130 [Streptomyces similanensis]|uniref:Uncharacterized protein n=1 Tax=Streptomyces similanensis TaxID=1274988 RepID=A0ABP9LP30_9ACTN